jgi:hypothetical protein
MHKRDISGLVEHRKKKEKEINEKVDNAIRKLVFDEKSINFNSVHELSGVNKATLYRKEDIRKRIEMLRQKEIEKKAVVKGKTDKSKDLIIAAKDKKIKELKNEIGRLKERIKIIEAELYDNG